MAEAKLYGQNKGGTSINGIIQDYYAYAGENISAGDLVEYVNGIAGKTDLGTSVDTVINNTVSNSGRYLSAVELDENKVFIAHCGSSSQLWGIVCTVNGAAITLGTDTQISAYSNTGLNMSAVRLDSNRVFIAHSYSSKTGDLYGTVAKIDGTTITKGNHTKISSASNASIAISTVLLEEDKVFVTHSYGSSYYLYGIVCTINNTSISASNDTSISTSSYTGYKISTCLLLNGKVFIAHSYGSNYYLYAIVCTISGTTITKGSDKALVSTTQAGGAITTTLLTNGNIFISHMYGDDGYLYGIVCSVNDTTITAGTDTALSTTLNSGYRLSTIHLTNNTCLILHSLNSVAYLYGMICRIDGTIINIESDTELIQGSNVSNKMDSIFLSNGAIFIAHDYESNHYLNAQVFCIGADNIPTNNIVIPEYETQVRKVTTGQFDGVAKTSGLGGDNTGHKDMVSIWTKGLYVDGAIAIWTAEDGLNENNQWVDRVSGYVFTPRSASVVPVHNSADKLIDFNQFGGMESNFKPGNIDYTIEIVTRDIANSKSESTSDGLIFTSASSSDGLHGFTFCQKNSSTVGIVQVNNNASQRVNHKLSSFETNSLDTFAATTSIQALNGEVVKNYTSTPEHTSVLTLGCRKGTSGFRAKFKVHCIRYYPFKLTPEQLAHNREVDIAIFGD